MLDDESATASLKLQSTNFVGITCEGYPTSKRKIGYRTDRDVWKMIKKYPGERISLDSRHTCTECVSHWRNASDGRIGHRILCYRRKLRYIVF